MKNQSLKVVEQQTEGISKQLEKQLEHNAAIGKTKEQIAELTASRLYDQAAQKDDVASTLELFEKSNLLSEEYRKQAQLLRDLAKAGQVGEAAQMSSDLSKTVEGGLKSAITAAFNGSQNPIESFGNALGKAVEASLVNSIADSMAKQFTSSTIGKGLMALFSADGNAFGSSSVHAFADGGAFTNSIVSQPTPFAFANGGSFGLGVMGEAGDEAVMPLTRDSSGKLGVKASGNTAPVQPIVVNQYFTVGDVASVSMVRQAVAGSERRIAAGIGRSQQYGGSMA